MINLLRDMWQDQLQIGAAKSESFSQHPVAYVAIILAASTAAVLMPALLKRRKRGRRRL